MSIELQALNTNYEPNWFLSTVVQSSAALIAIIGGFMISRIVYLASQKNDYTEKRATLESKLQIANQQAEELTDQINHKVEEWFLGDQLEQILRNDGKLDLEQILKDSTYKGSDPERIEAFAKQVAATSEKALSTLEEKFPNGTEIPGDADDLRSTGLEISDWPDSKIYEKAVKTLRERRLTPLQRAFGSTYFNTEGLMLSPNPSPGETQDDRLRRRRDLDYRLQSIYDEIQALVPIDKYSRGITTLLKGFATLVYFGISGVAFPLYLMTRNPVILKSNMRDAVYFGFLSGFGALLFFMMDTIRNNG